MSVSFEDAVKRARASWRMNMTRSDARSMEKQLHGLHNMLRGERQEILEVLQKSYYMSPETSELDLCFTIQDIARHIKSLNTSSIRSSLPRKNLATLQLKTLGVVLIMASANTTNTLKSIFGPISAAIAAGNVVIVANRTGKNHILEFLQSNSASYLNIDLFLVCTRVDVNASNVEGIDKIFTMGDATELCEELLSLPITTLIAPTSGANLVVIGEGRKKWPVIASKISTSIIGRATLSESLHGVFVRHEDQKSFSSAFNTTPANKNLSSVRFGRKSPNLFDASSINGAMMAIHLKDLLDASRYGGPDIARYLESARDQNLVLVILYTSLDQVIDALRKSTCRITYLAFMAPASPKAAQYLDDFVWSDIFCVDEIPLFVPRGLEGATQAQLSTEPTLFPTGLFSKPHLVLPSKAIMSSSDLAVSQIRASYEKIISPLKSDDRGERVGFFDQVLYTVVGVGSVLTIGLSFGAYCGWRVLYR